MDHVIGTVAWISVCANPPLTILGIIFLLCIVQKDQVPLIYYTNLLLCNLILLCTGVLLLAGSIEANLSHVIWIFCCGAMVSLGFRMCIAMERCCVITSPGLPCIRQMTGSALVCTVVWILCLFIVAIIVQCDTVLPLFIYGLLAAPVFLTCLAWTLKVLPAATSVPTDEKRRIVATLVLLLLSYCLMTLPTAILITRFTPKVQHLVLVSPSLLFLSTFVDLILLFFMQKGPVDKMLMHLCSGVDVNVAADVSSTSLV